MLFSIFKARPDFCRKCLQLQLRKDVTIETTQDESLYSITTVDRCTKLINNKITKIEIKYRPWIFFFWISTYETSHSFQPRSPITTHILLRPKLHITRRWTHPITIVDTTSLFSKKKSNEFTVHCNVFSQLQTFPTKEVGPCLTKYWKKLYNI